MRITDIEPNIENSCDIALFEEELSLLEDSEPWDYLVDEYLNSDSISQQQKGLEFIIDQDWYSIPYNGKYVVLTSRDILFNISINYLTSYEGIDFIKIIGDNLVVSMSCASGQGGYTIIFDLITQSVSNKLDEWITNEFEYIESLNAIAQKTELTAWYWLVHELKFLGLRGGTSTISLGTWRRDKDGWDKDAPVIEENPIFTKIPFFDPSVLDGITGYKFGYLDANYLYVSYWDHYYRCSITDLGLQ